MALGRPRHHILIRGASVAALGVSVLWLVVSPGFEPVITALLGLTGLLSTRPDAPAPDLGSESSAAVPTKEPFAGDPKSVAVLPLRNIGGDSDADVFSDGLTEDLIAQLGHVRELKVISRTSVMGLGDSAGSVREIGSILGVGSVLEGSVRRTADRLRVVVQLIDARSDRQLWSETFDRDLEHVFEIQSEIAINVSQALKAELSPEQAERIKSRPTTSLDAHDAFLIARHHWASGTEDGMERAKAYFDQAIGLDPDYAQAHAVLAYWYVQAGGPWSLMPAGEAMPLAKTAAERAIQLDPTTGDAYGTLATVESMYYWEWEKGRQTASLGIETDPNSYLAWLGYANVTCLLGERTECLRAMVSR